ncbi:MAG: class I SAM-dependent methyltransferase [Bacillaceae bacterium]
MNQRVVSNLNEKSWNQSAYQAWINRHGIPKQYAKKLKEDPTAAIFHYLKYIGDIKGKKIANLLGSKGNKAVSFALLGADVTVVDISQQNCNYALELAKEAGVSIQYIVSDVLEIPAHHSLSDADVVLLELGVLHYFIDLNTLFKVVYDSLKHGGIFILRDYHPFVSKSLQVDGDKMIATGNYFEKELVEENVAYSSLLHEEERVSLEKVKLKKWTLGEIITAISQADLRISRLEEECGVRWAFPSHSPAGMEDKIPGLYTLIAYK